MGPHIALDAQQLANGRLAANTHRCTHTSSRPKRRTTGSAVPASCRYFHTAVCLSISQPRRANLHRLSSLTCRAAAVEEAAPPAETSAAPTETGESTSPSAPQLKAGQRFQNGQSRQVQREAVETVPFKVGDTVLGRVVWAGERGSKVALDIDPRIRGFCPMSHTPLQLRNVMGRMLDLTVFPHLVREYLVLQIPEVVEVNGRGPLVSAKQPDMEVFWKRCHQIAELCVQDGEALRVTISYANRGGLIAVVGSMVVFVPFSRIPKAPGARLSTEDLEKEWGGKEVDVAIEAVEPENNKVLGSITLAAQSKLMRTVQVGAVVWTRIHSIQSFGVFLTIEGTSVNGLLHVSNISRARVELPEMVFGHGDRVRAIIIGMEKGFQRISFSTAELEENEGDMLDPATRELVYEHAEQQAPKFREYYQEMKDSGQVSDGGEVAPRRNRERPPRNGGQGQSFDFGYGDDNADDIWE